MASELLVRATLRLAPEPSVDPSEAIFTAVQAGGYQRSRGELLHLGVRVSATGIRTTLRRHGLDPAPRRAARSGGAFLCQQAAGSIAGDFLTVDTVWLRRL